MSQTVTQPLVNGQVPYFVNDIGLDGLYSITIAAGEGVLPAGQVLGKVTASGKYVAYDNGAADGSQTAIGILYHKVDAGLVADSDDEDVLGSMQVEGHVRESRLTGLDAAAKTDLAAKFFFVA